MDSRISMSFIIIQTLSTAKIGKSCVLSGNVLHREMQYKVHCVIYHMYQFILKPFKNQVCEDVYALLKLAQGIFWQNTPSPVFFFLCSFRGRPFDHEGGGVGRLALLLGTDYLFSSRTRQCEG